MDAIHFCHEFRFRMRPDTVLIIKWRAMVGMLVWRYTSTWHLETFCVCVCVSPAFVISMYIKMHCDLRCKIAHCICIVVIVFLSNSRELQTKIRYEGTHTHTHTYIRKIKNRVLVNGIYVITSKPEQKQ